MNIKRSIYKLRRKLICKFKGGRKILVLGDSHTGVFESLFDRELLLEHYISCDMVGGATAYGLNNFDSASKAREIFERSVIKNSGFDTVFVMLGEIDCSVTFWLLAEKYDRPASDFIGKAIENLSEFIDFVRSQPNVKDVVLVASPLPTVRDEQVDVQSYVFRRKIKATILQRTKMVLQYNEALRLLALMKGVMYLDVSESMLDCSTGVISERFCRRDLIDHHQCYESAAPVLARIISELFS